MPGVSATIAGCVVAGNTASQGAGVFCSYNSEVIVSSCTLSGNSASSEGGAVYCAQNGSVVITNSVLWGDGPEEIYVLSGTVVATHCDVQGGWAGLGNVSEDPLFANPNEGDYRLSLESPCIDAGDNDAVPGDVTKDLDGLPRFVDYPTVDDTGNGTPPIVDMGAYEFGTVDLNCDGTVDLFDIDPFVLALTAESQYVQEYPDCDRELADINGDGFIDLFDIDPFVELLTGG